MEMNRWDPGDYQLLDFGRGRKLESFGGVVLDRPCPAAEGIEKHSVIWESDLRLHGERSQQIELPSIRWNSIRFELRLTPYGHVGLFPEQWSNWNWLQKNVACIESSSRPKALNLFAYTGGTTLALASIGAEVTHVDSSQPAVRWARENAKLNALTEHPIRWIVEDARKYVHREVKRCNAYDVVVLDPPSYGHGTKGDRWDIEKDLLPLLRDICVLLERSSDPMIVFSAHCVQPNEADVIAMLRHIWKSNGSAFSFSSQRLDLQDQTGRLLDAGFAVRMSLAS